MQVIFYYDYGSPASYLAWTQLPAICARHGALLDHRPILIGGLFKITGNRSPVTVEAKGTWFFEDMARFADRYGVRFEKNPHFIINSLPLMRGALWAEGEGRLEGYNRTMFEACWVEGRDLNDPAVIMATLRDGGFDAEAVAAAIQTDSIKKRLIEVTQEAADQGIFGVPSMIVAGELHFGQDRLDWVEDALRRAQPAA
ncbi:MAG: 2-hydroxychromene-2-carboxylate isomerase [Rhizobiales bacterium]|nr:2-hydroxychromene-2-carboxylate isomerase [Hyphomicrobiales bacterium]